MFLEGRLPEYTEELKSLENEGEEEYFEAAIYLLEEANSAKEEWEAIKAVDEAEANAFLIMLRLKAHAIRLADEIVISGDTNENES
ncbi:MAG: hypothetical protein M2R45_03890 [Verrucomicrobia subdivision 3 bacterium]|nr:hypothetical protein [Limisphaerales bacterium]MCS1412593.1 hypothetical protein [Limisphaerales bacterium]